MSIYITYPSSLDKVQLGEKRHAFTQSTLGYKKFEFKRYKYK
jgi:hypothetical protein